MPARCCATVRDGKLRGLAMTARKRSPNMPELPTMIEAGVADFEVTSWNVMVTRPPITSVSTAPR